MDIDDTVAVVTGGASGIGRATVLALAGRGASVVVADRDVGGGERTVALAGGCAVFVPCDVTRSGDLATALATAQERFGGLDIVCNVAGVGDGDLFADDAGDWRLTIDIDLTAVVDMTRQTVRALRRAGRGGAIVQVASLIGLYPMSGAPVYAAAKAGVVNFTRSLADLADRDGIRVNAVCPELVDTAMAQAMGEETVRELRKMGGILPPERIADAIVALVEDDERAGAILQVTVEGGATYVD